MIFYLANNSPFILLARLYKYYCYCNLYDRFGPLYGCLPLAINGTLPLMWDWLENAVDGGKADYMNSVVEVWAGKDAVSS